MICLNKTFFKFIIFICFYLSKNDVALGQKQVNLTYNNLISTEHLLLSSLSDVKFNKHKLIFSDWISGIYVVEWDAPNFYQNLNNRGRGPGEFENLKDFLVNTSDQTILILDSNLDRVSFYDLGNFQFIKSYLLPKINNASDGSPYSPDAIWEVQQNGEVQYILEYTQSFTYSTVVEERRKKYVLYDSEFQIIDSEFLLTNDDEDYILQIYEDGGFSVSWKPFGRKNLIDFTPKGEPVTFWTDNTCFSINSERHCLELEEIEIDKETKKILKKNDFTEDELSQLDRTFPSVSSMFLEINEQTNKHIIWFSRYTDTNDLQILEYSILEKKLKNIFQIPKFLELKAIQDGIAILATHELLEATEDIFLYKLSLE